MRDRFWTELCWLALAAICAAGIFRCAVVNCVPLIQP